MKKPTLKTVLLSLSLFLFFLVVQFPYGNFKGYLFSKIYSMSHILIIAEDIYPSFFGWPGLGMRQVDVNIPLGMGDLEFSANKVVARVGLGGLVPPAPSFSLSVKGLKKGGDFYVKYFDTANATKGALEADNVVLEQLAFSGMADPIKGKLDLDGDIYLDKSELSKSSGGAEINAEKIIIPAQNLQGFILPQLSLGALKAKIRVKNGLAELQGCQFGGPGSDLSGTISGDIKLGKDFMSSFLNLTVRLQVSDSYRKNTQAGLLLSLLNSYQAKTQGQYAMKWSARIGEMSTNLMSAIPQKVD